MPDTKGKVNLLDTVPVQCGHITTEWEGEYAILSFPRFKYDWMRRFLLPKSMSADIHVKLEEHGTAVWRLIDGNRTVQEIISLLTDHFQNEVDAEAQKHIKKFEEEPELEILNGRYGPYISYKGNNYKIPKDIIPQDLNLDACREIIKLQSDPDAPKAKRGKYAKKKK